MFGSEQTLAIVAGILPQAQHLPPGPSLRNVLGPKVALSGAAYHLDLDRFYSAFQRPPCIVLMAGGNIWAAYKQAKQKTIINFYLLKRVANSH